jgi:hypothetical protein
VISWFGVLDLRVPQNVRVAGFFVQPPLNDVIPALFSEKVLNTCH